MTVNLPVVSVTTKQAAQMTGLPESSVRRLIRNGELAARLTGRYYLIPVAAITELIAEATAERRAS